MKVLITGGTGSLGQELAGHFSDVTIFSRNEANQVEMRSKYPHCKYLIGDVRDSDQVMAAVKGHDYVFHLAALKHIDICETQPDEAVKTNIVGTMNMVNACSQNGVKLVNMSSDKAINATSIYGMTKFIGEKIASDYVSIRSGNILWSSGSVLPLWRDQLEKKNTIRITDKRMTRFFVHPADLARYIISSKDEKGIKTTPMLSFNLYEIAVKFVELFGNSDSKIIETGMRPGERLHEYRDKETSSEHNICTDLNYIFDVNI